MNDRAIPLQNTGNQPWIDLVPEIRILRIGRVTLGRNWAHTLLDDSWRLYLMNGNTASIRHGSSHFPLPHARPVLIPSWLRFDCIPGPGARQDYIQFLVPDIPAGVTRKYCNFPTVLPDLPGLSETISTVGDLAESGGEAQKLSGIALLPAAIAANSALNAYLGLIDPSGRARIESLYSHLHPVQLLAKEVSANPLEPWDVDRLAKKAGCSRKHLSRLFQKHLHQSPARFIREQRLIRAGDMLLHGEDSIESIATKCGFGDRFSFSRAFTRLYKTGPGQYREQRYIRDR